MRWCSVKEHGDNFTFLITDMWYETVVAYCKVIIGKVNKNCESRNMGN
jgi:hypothetical protein